MNFQSIIKSAYNELPMPMKQKPWQYVNHGVDPLVNNEQLNCYLAAYGTMHEAKIKLAIDSISDLEQLLCTDYQIIDWGCGQALATIVFLECLRERNISKLPSMVNLIEPSAIALAKGESYVKNIATQVQINSVNKYLNDLNADDIQINKPLTIHFFSNILDIETIDLDSLIGLVNAKLQGEHCFICVGPMNATSTRIDSFANKMNISTTDLIGSQKGSLKNTRGTVKLLVFKVKGTEIKIIKSIFYPPMPKDSNMLHILEKKLYDIDTNSLNGINRIIEYYKLVVELEQLREPEIKSHEKRYYEYELEENNGFVVDLESNPTFLNIFNINRNSAITPLYKAKDVYISFEFEFEKKKYPLLSYTYTFNDIKSINTAVEKINLKLSSFELNFGVVSKFVKNHEAIDELDKFYKENNSIAEVLEFLKKITNTDFKFDDKLCFALSAKNPALSQIYAEIKRLNSSLITQDSLLYNFLFNHQIDNKHDEQTEADLIQICNLDDSQKKAVLSAFNNKVTVVTGPPGSGKTQVITNIVANAVFQNKKVLVASKNNQAVDNVKERFDKDEKTGFFLRFGSKEVLKIQTLPNISQLSDFKSTLIDNQFELNESLKALKRVISVRDENKSNLEKRDSFVANLPRLSIEVQELEEKLNSFKTENSQYEEIRQSYQIDQIQHKIASIKKKRNLFESKYAGLNKFWIDWFTIKKHALDFITYKDDFELKIQPVLKSIPDQLSSYSKGLELIKSYNDLILVFEDLLNYISLQENLVQDVLEKKTEFENAESFISMINLQESAIKQEIENCEPQIINLSKIVLKEKINNKIFNSNQFDILNYSAHLPDKIPTYTPAAVKLFENTTKNFLNIFNIISVTSLSAKASLPLSNELFDMVIIDEASQCDIASAIPLILRAKQLVVIGDPKQLKHISSLNSFEEERIKEHLNLNALTCLNFKNNSLWDYTGMFLKIAKTNNQKIDLNGHYRCHKSIIGYSKQFVYSDLGINLNICTKEENYNVRPNGMQWIDVIGVQKSETININDQEVEKCIELATDFHDKYPNKSIGIVTSFRHQANEISNKLPDLLKSKITVGTVHVFQGDEKDIMIYSLVVTNNSPASKLYFIDDMVPESVNVAVTRAKNTLIIVGNKEYIKTNSINKPLGKLAYYVDNLQN
jgi:RecA/RadA recombinase